MHRRYAAFALAWLLGASPDDATSVAVRQTEGALHGFLTLRTMEGTLLAEGDLIQVAHGDRVNTQLVFHFKDGSVHDERAIYSQHGEFRLISDHLVQRGPAFPVSIDAGIDCASGQVVVEHAGKDGQPKHEDDRLTLPPDLANGMILTLLKNVPSTGQFPPVSFLAMTPKPRLVTLVTSKVGEEPVSIAGHLRKATHYAIKVHIGGLEGLLAPLVGKQPPDSHVWILPGEAPAFVKAEEPFYLGGPLWRIELTSPVWPKAAPPPG